MESSGSSPGSPEAYGSPGPDPRGSGYPTTRYDDHGQTGYTGQGPYGQYGSPYQGQGYGPGGSSPGGPPPTEPGPPATGGGGDGGGRRSRRSPVLLAVAALVALLLVGGIGGAVGYEAASSGSGGSNSVLSGASTSGESTSSSPAAAGSVESVAQTVLPSVVQLKGPSGEGSGIVISADGLILTNAHVLEAGQPAQQQSGLGGLLGGGDQEQQSPSSSVASLTAVFQNGNSAPVQVVGTDVTADLAVVRAQNVSGLTPVQLGDSSALKVGQEVVAVGSPLGLSGTVTTGIVSALQRPVATGGAQSGQSTVIDAVQTDAAINPGNSGGALVDMNGRVVGITSAIASLGSSSSGGSSQQSGSIGLGFAIPINQAARIGQELAKTGSATQAVLGVSVADASPTGATLGQLTPGGPAAAAGLVQGDVVTRVNDRVIDDADSLVAAIRSQQPGAAVTLTVTSAGKAARQVPVTLGTEKAPTS